jgi:hypothetical protein
MSGKELGKGIFQEWNLTVRRMGWLTLDMSGEESGKGICLSGEREDLSGRSPAVRAATLPLEILSSDPEHATIQLKNYSITPLPYHNERMNTVL